jgi:signal peptidase I
MADDRVALPDVPPPPGASPQFPDDEPTTGWKALPYRGVIEWVGILVGALLVAFLVKTFLFQAFYIPSASMTPTLKVSDRVLVNKLSYDFHDVHRGDIIVFKSPPGGGDATVKDLIKRVIGLPGERVEGHDGRVYVDGRELVEPYLPEGTLTEPFGPATVPGDHVWVMGDNRPSSADSRVFGPIQQSSIVGRAIVRVWPIPHSAFL